METSSKSKRPVVAILNQWQSHLMEETDNLHDLLQRIEDSDELGPESRKRLRLLTESLITRIANEVDSYRDEREYLSEKRDLEHGDLDRVEKLKSRYNRIVVQIQKLLISIPKINENTTKKPAKSSLKHHVDFASPSLKEELSYVDEETKMAERYRDDPDGWSSAVSTKRERDRSNRHINTGVGNSEKNYMKGTFTSKMTKKMTEEQIKNLEKQLESLKSQHQRMNSGERKTHQTQQSEKHHHYGHNYTDNPVSMKKGASNLADQLNSEWIDSLMRHFGSSMKKGPGATGAAVDVKRKQSNSAVRKKDDSRVSYSKTANKPTRVQMQTDIKGEALDLLKNEIEALKSICAGFLHKIDTHNHPEYENDLEKLKLENAKVISEYKVLQQENTDLVKDMHDIKKEMKALERENETLVERMRKLKVSHRDSSNAKRSTDFENDRPRKHLQERTEDYENDVPKQAVRTSDKREGVPSAPHTTKRFLLQPGNTLMPTRDDDEGSYLRQTATLGENTTLGYQRNI